MGGLLRLFAVIAILLQGTALQLCALSQLTIGSNCHESTPTLTCEGHTDRSTCACERPGASSEPAPAFHIDMLATAVPTVSAPFDIPAAAAFPEAAFSTADLNELPPWECTLPLLF